MRKILFFFTRTELFFFSLLWLIFLLIAGTIAQKYLGLYLAQQKYFSSYVIWIANIIPVPGGYSTMLLISLSLVIKIFYDKWELQNLGTIIIHIGVLLLLIGGFVTMKFSKEGNMLIKEGESSNYINDYHKLELVINDISAQNYQHIIKLDESYLRPGNIIKLDNLNANMTIKKFYRNSKIIYNESNKDITKLTSYDMSQLFELKKVTPAKIEEQNNSGIEIMVNNENNSKEYNIFELMPIAQYIKIGKKYYHVQLRHIQTTLPFTLKLIDFKKQNYAGTNKAQNYQSDIIVEDNNVNWYSTIKMNKPLRYKGYSFYQSSFIEDSYQNTSTILAVVQNEGRLYPYIATIIICLGLLMHLIQNYIKKP